MSVAYILGRLKLAQRYVTRTPLSRSKVKGQLVADVLNSQHTETGATWRINTKILSTCRGGGISWRPPAQLAYEWMNAVNRQYLPNYYAEVKLTDNITTKSILYYFPIIFCIKTSTNSSVNKRYTSYWLACFYTRLLMPLNASFASERMMQLKLSQLRSLFPSDNSDRPRGVAKPITVLFSVTETQTPVCWYRGDVDQPTITDADVDFRRRRGHPWWRRPTNRRPVFLLVLSHCGRSMTNSSLHSATASTELLLLSF